MFTWLVRWLTTFLVAYVFYIFPPQLLAHVYAKHNNDVNCS